MRWASIGRENQLLSSAPILHLEGRGRMCREETGFRSTEGRGLEKCEIAFRRREVWFRSRRFAGVQQETEPEPTDQPWSKGPGARRSCVTCIPVHKESIHKLERGCEPDDKTTPAFLWKAGVESHDVREELSSLAIKHRIFCGVPEQISLLARELVYRSVQAVIQRMSNRVQEKTGPAPGVVVRGRSSRHIGIDQGRGVHDTIDAGGRHIASICIGRYLLLVVAGTTDCGGQKKDSHCQSCSSHR